MLVELRQSFVTAWQSVFPCCSCCRHKIVRQKEMQVEQTFPARSPQRLLVQRFEAAQVVRKRVSLQRLLGYGQVLWHVQQWRVGSALKCCGLLVFRGQRSKCFAFGGLRLLVQRG